jgi:hypothetical protein
VADVGDAVQAAQFASIEWRDVPGRPGSRAASARVHSPRTPTEFGELDASDCGNPVMAISEGMDESNGN